MFKYSLYAIIWYEKVLLLMADYIESETDKKPTTEDFLPVLVYVLIKSNTPQFISNIKYCIIIALMEGILSNLEMRVIYLQLLDFS